VDLLILHGVSSSSVNSTIEPQGIQTGQRELPFPPILEVRIKCESVVSVTYPTLLIGPGVDRS
jgi:hypothetical protein